MRQKTAKWRSHLFRLQSAYCRSSSVSRVVALIIKSVRLSWLNARPANASKKPLAAFGGIPVPWVLLGVLGAGLMAGGNKRVADDVVDRPPSTCPLETS